MSEILEPISLGYSCDVKYQVSRNIYFRLFPEASETDFRNMLFRWQGQPTVFRRHIFDWMIAPFEAVRTYLEDDFQGVFERADLEIAKEGTTVRHRTLLTYHPHDFHGGPDGRLTEAMVDEQYEGFRSKHEFLAERFRGLLGTPGPYLYVYKEIIKQADARRLADLLRARSPDHRFQLLFVDVEGAVNQVLSQVSVPAFKGWLPPDCDKPQDRQWEGADAPWNDILSRFNLGLHGAEAPLAGAAPPAAPAPVVVAPLRRPPSSGWRTLLSAEGPSAFLAAFTHVDPLRPERLYAVAGRQVSFDNPLPDDHFFCQFLPVALGPGGGWARVTLDWPADPSAPRAGAALQDQECRHPKAWSAVSKAGGGVVRETVVLPLGADVDHIRLVMTPTGPARSDLPLRATLEVADAATPGVWSRLLSAVGIGA